MKIYSEISLRNFNFWCGAKDRVCDLTDEQLDEVEEILEDLYPEGMSETEVNDLFWFDFETIKEWLGLPIMEESELDAWWKDFDDQLKSDVVDFYLNEDDDELESNETSCFNTWTAKMHEYWSELSYEEKWEIYKDNE